MPLYLVGENIDKTRSHYQVQRGKLVQLMRGIYVDAGEDLDTTLLKHAVRIARYLYPNAYLSAASAVLLGPTRDGQLFLSGRRIQRTRLRSLEIIQNTAPEYPSVAPAIVKDSMGEYRVEISSIRQRFLEAFRLRSEHAASLNDTMREAIANRLIEEYASAQGAADALWSLARENQWYREGERAERFLLKKPMIAESLHNESALNLMVAWHGVPIGRLSHDGFEWRWHSHDRDGPLLVRQNTPGKLPPFILSLMPEGWLESVLNNRDERTMLRSGKRYMSNITIVEHTTDLETLVPDILLTSLKSFTCNGLFIGQYAGPGRSNIEQSFEQNLAQVFKHTDTPHLSGVQIKAPMFLNEEGVLCPSTGQPFTHILKPAGTRGYEALPLIEWQSLALGRSVGFITPETALVPMPDGMPPALLVERFDIQTSLADKRLLALEDFCSVLGVPTEAKYNGTMERVARALRALSSMPEEDILLALKRALFAWLIADGDMHLKNIALLKMAHPGSEHFYSVRMAPLYDAVTTRVFPRLEQDRMALKLNGKDDRLRRADFKTFARTASLKATVAEAAIDDLIRTLSDALDHLTLPPPLMEDATNQEISERMRIIIRERLEKFV